MSEQEPYNCEVSSQANIFITSQSPTPVETTKPLSNLLETALTQAMPETDQAPFWFSETVNKISAAWFDPKSFESPEAYERIGIRAVKKYLPTSGDFIRRVVWKRFGDEAWVKHGNVQSLKNQERFTRVFEGVHLAAVGVFSTATGFLLAQGDIKGAVAATAINAIYNAYPIMLQRYNRLRLYRAINHMEEKQSLPQERSLEISTT